MAILTNSLLGCLRAGFTPLSRDYTIGGRALCPCAQALAERDSRAAREAGDAYSSAALMPNGSGPTRQRHTREFFSCVANVADVVNIVNGVDVADA